MPPIKEAGLKKYGDKLYRGELALYKKKLAERPDFDFGAYYESVKKPERVGKTTSQARQVKARDKMCKICSDKDCLYEGTYNIHHINGDRSKTVVPNLLLVCSRCHKRLHTYANAKLRDYKVTNKLQKTKKNKSLFGDFGFGPTPKRSKRRKKKDPLDFW